MNQEKITVYLPDKHLKIGFINSWKEMFNELIRSRELIWRLFLRDFGARYRQSILGISWAIINPIITVGIFIFLNRSGVLTIGETKIPYIAFALIGLSIWALFSHGLTTCSNSIIQGGSIIVRIKFPMISLPIASYGQALVEFFIRVGLTIIVFIYFSIFPEWTVIFLPIAILPIAMLTIGLGFFLSLGGAIFRDIPNIVTMFTTFMLFLFPVAYPAPSSGVFASINQWNPLSHLIIGCRDLVISGQFSNPTGFILSSIFSIILFLLSWRFFHLVEGALM